MATGDPQIAGLASESCHLDPHPKHGAARTSLHRLVQDLLNRSGDHLWGFVFDGLRLRVLRDNLSLTRQAYVELDREANEVVETVPGETVTLEDSLDRSRVTVVERTASRTLERATLVAARVVPGPGTAPAVIEAGLVAFPPMAKRSIVDQTREHLEGYRARQPGASVVAFFKELVPALFHAWARLLVEPPIPHLVNTDHEDMLWTTTRFAVRDAVFASDDVFYLPGLISISQTRQLERLEHVPSGRMLMTRFMVRRHWRRPARTWKDQSMRWIRPYWKGPDIAAVIERAYRLEP